MTGFTTHFWLATPTRNMRALLSFDGLRLRATAILEPGDSTWTTRIWDPTRPGTWRVEQLESTAKVREITDPEVEGEGGVVRLDVITARWVVDPSGTAAVLVAEIRTGEVWLLGTLYRVAGSEDPDDVRWSPDPDALAGGPWTIAAGDVEWKLLRDPDGESRGRRISDDGSGDEREEDVEVDVDLLDRTRAELDGF